VNQHVQITDELDRDPGLAWFRGRFYPDRCATRSCRWELVGKGPSLLARHVPLGPDVLDARLRFGPAAEPLLDAWTRLWGTVAPEGNFEAYARDKSIVTELEGGGWAPETLARAERNLRNGLRAAAAEAAMHAVRANGDDRVRDRAFHVMEDAAKHVALAASGLPFCLGVCDRAGKVHYYGPDGKGGLRALPSLGPEWFDGAEGQTQTRRADNPYWTLEAFRSRAGRGMAVGSGPSHVEAILLDMALQGHAKAFLKGVVSKSGTWVVDIGGVTPGNVRHRLRAAIGDSIVDLMSDDLRRRSLLVQELTPFVREHRFVVVAHRVVASTPSDRGLGVLNARPDRILRDEAARLDLPAGGIGAFDRGEATTERDRPLAARMAACARGLAHAVGREWADVNATRGGIPDCYCVDVGETLDGRVLPIEINTLLNCGLYALDFPRVVRALERRAARIEAGTNAGGGASGLADRIRMRDEAVAGGTPPHRPRIGDCVSDAEVEALTDRYVEAAATGGHLASVLAFGEQRHKEIWGYLRASRPGLRELDMARESTFFQAWDHPGWDGTWREWLRERATANIQAVRRRIGGFAEGTHPILIVLAMECEPDEVAEAFAAMDPPDWQEGYALKTVDGGPSPIFLTADVDREDVDWPGSILAQAMLADEIDPGRPIAFRPGARIRIAGREIAVTD
jgi:hypothetical protein